MWGGSGVYEKAGTKDLRFPAEEQQFGGQEQNCEFLQGETVLQEPAGL